MLTLLRTVVLVALFVWALTVVDDITAVVDQHIASVIAQLPTTVQP